MNSRTFFLEWGAFIFSLHASTLAYAAPGVDPDKPDSDIASSFNRLHLGESPSGENKESQAGGDKHAHPKKSTKTLTPEDVSPDKFDLTHFDIYRKLDPTTRKKLDQGIGQAARRSDHRAIGSAHFAGAVESRLKEKLPGGAHTGVDRAIGANLVRGGLTTAAKLERLHKRIIWTFFEKAVNAPRVLGFAYHLYNDASRTAVKKYVARRIERTPLPALIRDAAHNRARGRTDWTRHETEYLGELELADAVQRAFPDEHDKICWPVLIENLRRRGHLERLATRVCTHGNPGVTNPITNRWMAEHWAGLSREHQQNFRKEVEGWGDINVKWTGPKGAPVFDEHKERPSGSPDRLYEHGRSGRPGNIGSR